jgi:RNase P protein component
MITAEKARNILKVTAQRYSEEVFKKIKDAALEGDDYVIVERKKSVEDLVLDQLGNNGFDARLYKENLYIRW